MTISYGLRPLGLLPIQVNQRVGHLSVVGLAIFVMHKDGLFAVDVKEQGLLTAASARAQVNLLPGQESETMKITCREFASLGREVFVF